MRDISWGARDDCVWTTKGATCQYWRSTIVVRSPWWLSVDDKRRNVPILTVNDRREEPVMTVCGQQKAHATCQYWRSTFWIVQWRGIQLVTLPLNSIWEIYRIGRDASQRELVNYITELHIRFCCMIPYKFKGTAMPIFGIWHWPQID